MDLRSSRSRSKTPFTVSAVEQDIVRENHVEQSISKSSRRITTTTIKTTNGGNTIDNLSEEYSSHYVKPLAAKRFTKITKYHKTSDYSSEEGENEVSSTKNISENERNRILEDARKVADNPSGITALGLYRKAQRYWDEYPKTDWTYSPFSKDRVEIAPGVVAMPNMSRRHISSYDKYTNTDSENSFFSPPRPKKLFTSISEKTTITTILKRTIVSTFLFFVSIVYIFMRSISYVYKSAHSVSVRVAKVIHRATSRVMLFDTWLLRSRGNQGKTASLISLCAVPLLLIAGWWIVSNMGENLYGFLLNDSSFHLSQGAQSEMTSDHIHPEIRPGEDYSEEPRSHEIHLQQSANSEEIASSLTANQLKKITEYVESNLNLNDEIVNRLLNTESIKNVINNYNIHSHLSDLEIQDKLEQQRIIIDELTKELQKMRVDLVNIKNREIDIDKLKLDIQSENVRKIDQLVFQLNRCCRKSINLESYIIKSLSSYLNNPDFLQRQEGLKNWLHSLFIAKTELENKLSNLTESLNSKFDELLESNSKFLMDQVTSTLHSELNSKYKRIETIRDRTEGDISLTDQKIRDIVKDTLKIYDADKTGLVDYAMEPMGGQVITTRCTETYHARTAVLSVLGIPLWYPSSSPRSAITPGLNPGKCWAFQNFPGLLVVKLIAPVKIEAFSIEHISKLLVPDGKIDSAPKGFEVYGLKNEEDRHGVRIGQYTFDYNGEALQFFIAHVPDQIFEYVELRIISNHGNPNYTCLYRFRVHGKIQVTPS